MSNQYVNDFTDVVRIYYDDLKKYKPLSRAKEKKLLRKCKKGNLQAKNEILEANLRFVFDMARHYTGRGVPISDLISDGNMGLMRAIDKFDDSKDVKFISYAVWWIRQAMLESIKKRKLMNLVDINADENNDKSFDSKMIYDENDEEPYNGNDLSNEYDEKKKEVSENQKIIVSELLDTLNERERDIIENYFGINDKKELTLTDIGKKYSISTERVRQIKLNCLKKLRSKMLLYEDFEDFLI